MNLAIRKTEKSRENHPRLFILSKATGDRNLSTGSDAISKSPAVGERISHLITQISAYQTPKESQDPQSTTVEAITIEAVKIGDLLDDYEILEEVGSGGMAVVYKARRLTGNNSESIFALKTLHPGTHRKIDIERLIREASALNKLDHPNIVKIIDVSNRINSPYISMEFVHGVTLNPIIKELHNGNSNITLKCVLDEIAVPILCALQYAHDQGVLHRDIKPENVFINMDGIPKLGDFGLAIFSDTISLTGDGSIIGTIPYAPPERFGPDHKPDVRSDIYSFGVVLYQTATGELPFPGDHVNAVIGKILRGIPKTPSSINPSIPSALDDIILKAINKDPDKRFPSAKSLASSLQSSSHLLS